MHGSLDGLKEYIESIVGYVEFNANESYLEFKNQSFYLKFIIYEIKEINKKVFEMQYISLHSCLQCKGVCTGLIRYLLDCKQYNYIAFMDVTSEHVMSVIKKYPIYGIEDTVLDYRITDYINSKCNKDMCLGNFYIDIKITDWIQSNYDNIPTSQVKNYGNGKIVQAVNFYRHGEGLEKLASVDEALLYAGSVLGLSIKFSNELSVLGQLDVRRRMGYLNHVEKSE